MDTSQIFHILLLKTIISCKGKKLVFCKELAKYPQIGKVTSLCSCRLCVPSWFEIWELIGVWELNGLRHAFWIMIHAPTMETGHMEQVNHFLIPLHLHVKNHNYILRKQFWLMRDEKCQNLPLLSMVLIDVCFQSDFCI